jgi:hypothetical protein
MEARTIVDAAVRLDVGNERTGEYWPWVNASWILILTRGPPRVFRTNSPLWNAESNVKRKINSSDAY